MRRARSAASGTVSSGRDPAACRSQLLCSRSPHSLGYFDDARQLCPLLVFRKRVALFGAGEPTLRTETKLIEIHEFGRLLDSPLQVVDRLQRTRLRSHHAQNHDLPFGHEPQRIEAAGTLRIEFHEVPIHANLVEQQLRDRLVSALRDPARAKIPPAEM